MRALHHQGSRGIEAEGTLRMGSAVPKTKRGGRYKRGLSHPASPSDQVTEPWYIPCERDSCHVSFSSGSKQRRYCSSECKRMVERRRSIISAYRLEAISRVCSEPTCSTKFVPQRVQHRFCKRECAQKARRRATQFGFEKCLECDTKLVDRTVRARYCDAVCRVRASRKRSQPS